ncbi:MULTISPECIES: hypothetical protein [Nostocaceae]|uniref:hypothetical protein n=1 Tax=Nostocaceae TaxID=1162 RepID=UPI001F54C1B4|nr:MULTISPECIES: hypothetical protein [Nostocaceae]
MSSDEIRAGSKEMMTHAQRQAFLKTSSLGQLFGVANLLPEVEAADEESSEELPRLKRVRGLFKLKQVGHNQHSSTDAEISKTNNQV